MKIDRLILGGFQTNCYVVRRDESAQECLIVDAGLDADELLAFLMQNALRPVAIVLTHGHADHIVGVAALRRQFPDVKVYIHPSDAGLLDDPRANLRSIELIVDGQSMGTLNWYGPHLADREGQHVLLWSTRDSGSEGGDTAEVRRIWIKGSSIFDHDRKW